MGESIEYLVREDPRYGKPVTGTVLVTESGKAAYVQAAYILGKLHPDFYDIKLTLNSASVYLRSENAVLDRDLLSVKHGGLLVSEQAKQGTYIRITPHVVHLLDLQVEKNESLELEERFAA